jgi:hypothetical protein
MKTKIAVSLFTILLIIGVSGTFWGTQIVEAASGLWNSCPRGETNCRYPGKCHSYVDTNDDRICDRSQSAPHTATPTPSLTATTVPATTTTSTPTSTLVPSSTSSKSSENVLAAIIPQNNSSTPAPSLSDQYLDVSDSTQSEDRHSYYLLPILLVIVVLYALTWTLSARKIIRNMFHRKIWNLILLVSSLVSALLGIILIINIDFGTNIILPFNMLFWHVEAGIALGIIAIFHIFWHWRYFMKILGMNSTAKVISDKITFKKGMDGQNKKTYTGTDHIEAV